MIATLITAAALVLAPPGPTVAVEDTMRTEVPEVLVRAPRITLDEILDRVARGEARRDSALRDQSFLATVRVVRNVTGRGKPELLMETVTRVYKRRPDKVRAVVLRQWEKSGRGERVNVDFKEDMSESVVGFAFRPEARREYHFKIVGRDLVGSQLIYRIAFQPKSRLDPSRQSGEVWVNTNQFVILREELDFDRSPVPLFIKDIKRMVVERAHVDGHWVLNRVLLRAETSLPLPRLGRSFDFIIRFDQYQNNRGIPDRIFDPRMRAQR